MTTKENLFWISCTKEYLLHNNRFWIIVVQLNSLGWTGFSDLNFSNNTLLGTWTAVLFWKFNILFIYLQSDSLKNTFMVFWKTVSATSDISSSLTAARTSKTCLEKENMSLNLFCLQTTFACQSESGVCGGSYKMLNFYRVKVTDKKNIDFRQALWKQQKPRE